MVARKIIENIVIEKLANGGEGLAYLPDGRVLFVEEGLPGDRVNVELRKAKKSWARGRVTEIVEASSEREAVRCDAFKRGCGGCQFWGVSYEQEVKWKVQAAWEAMKRISGVDLPMPEVITSPSVRNYRSRITLHQRKRSEEEIVRGFFAAGTRQVVRTEDCPVADKAIDEALEEFGGALSLLGDADIALETAGEKTVVVLVQLQPGQRIRHDILNELSLRLEQGTVVKGIEIIDERGKHFIIGDTTVAASEMMAFAPVEAMQMEPGHFRQANPEVNRRLVQYVREAVEKGGEGRRVLELFCGSGNFSFPMAQVASSLIGVEGNARALEAGRQMAALAKDMTHVGFRVADLSDEVVIEDLLSDPFNVLVLDPPREGAREASQYMASQPMGEQIIYISCDAACLGRDIKTLSQGGWKVEELTAFDMFPRTFHLEVVAVLGRAKD